MKKLSYIIVSCLFLIILNGCMDKEAQSAEIDLAANTGSTGYSWEYQLSDDSLFSVESDYDEDDDEALVGAMGEYSIDLKAIKAGKTTLTLQYKRSWEDESIYTLTYEFEIDDDLQIKLTNSNGNYFEDMSIPTVIIDD